jgi:hypothetical protein
MESLDLNKKEIKLLQEENYGLKTALERKNNEVELWVQKFRNESVNRSHDLNEILAEYDSAKRVSIVNIKKSFKSHQII